ncbi:MAG: FMN-binding protein [Candidatus Brocadiae bacterium]|nr:FMN-binding protein [Candidatus Brocadiia bacterium]
MKSYIRMVLFLFVLSAISAILLTFFALETKEYIAKNRQKERFIHILKAMRILPEETQKLLAKDEKLKSMPDSTVQEKFQKEAVTIERTEYYLKKEKTEQILETFSSSIDVLELTPKNQIVLYKGKEFAYLPSNKVDYLHNLYIFRAKKEDHFYYTFEIAGAGFWDKVAGYMALKEGFKSIAGITFYDHKETPGLGQRIEEGWFQGQFTFWNKSIFREGSAQPELRVTSRKGTYDGEATQDFGKKQNEVDAITGASETSRALDRFVTKNLLHMFGRLAKIVEGKEGKEFFDTTTQAFLKNYPVAKP